MRAFLLACLVLASCDGQVRFEADPEDSAVDTTGDGAVEDAADSEVDAVVPKCKVDGDCPFASLHCEPTSGKCVPCLADIHCAAYSFTPRCDLTTHSCVECTLDAQCGGDEGKCDAHRCLRSCASEACVSGETPSCNPTRKVCTCTSSSCTSGERPRCDTMTGLCVQCAGDGDCKGDEHRCVSGQCVHCTVDADCAAGRCDPVRHECVD
ncbi:MAG: hypothetical protein ACXVEF_31095 [Polyangiales bacterium]